MEKYQASPRFRSTLDQKADLFSILKTADFLRQRFSTGMVDSGFYIKRMQFFNRELSQLQAELMHNNLTLLHLLDKMKINQDLKSIVIAISSSADLKFHDFAQQWQIDPYKLASATAEITSDFITLLDYLHLVDIVEDGLMMELFNRLLAHLQLYNAFSPFHNAVEKLREKTEYNLLSILNSRKEPQNYPQLDRSFYPATEYQLSLIFEKFKDFLQLA